ncbi:MAG TPA: MBL fold metallo-hydrolase [Blastocatellia bacterium]|nr:MBL fold metallo-hydrolase [Blastocatellia bacterium]
MRGVMVLLIVLAATVAGGSPFRCSSVESARSVQSRTEIVLLGTGTPNADPDRLGPSVAIVVNDTPYLVDFGPGVVRRAAAAAQKGIKGLVVKNLNRAFATHLHSDHTAGYSDLILTPWVLERKDPLEVYGPKGIKAMTGHILKAYQSDIYIRLRGGEPSNKTGFRVIAHEIKPGVVYKDQNVTVKAFLVDHGSWREAYGFRFETADRTIVISGDCRPSPAVIQNCNGCDVLIHEVYSQAGFATRPPEWQKYHSRYHTSSRELAEIADKARPGLLVLYHQLFWGTSEDDLLREIRASYAGKVVSGHDLDVY